jgi:magnesium-protoporphyrin O-methyltransferase
MPTASYIARRESLETYFDRTASDAWVKLTSDAPLSRIRATVRAGRERMRATLLNWLPQDLRGSRILDAGCGTGAFALEAAKRGAHAVAIDLSPTLVDLARQRYYGSNLPGRVDFLVGDMLDPSLGSFDHVVAMDSLIHYRSADMTGVLARLAPRTKAAILFTFAPKTAALTIMHMAGRLFPRGNRAPAIEPVSHRCLTRLIEAEPALNGWKPARGERIQSGFYTSEAMELTRA